MSDLIQNIQNLVVTPPGNLACHLVLSFALLAAIQSLSAFRQSLPGILKRSLIALGFLLAVQIALFFASTLAWQGYFISTQFLPILDRASLLLGILWIGWIWCFPKNDRLGDLLVGLLSLVAVGLFIFSLTSWEQVNPATPFNISAFDFIWTILSLVIAATITIYLLIKREQGWGVGAAFFLLHIAGIVIHLLYTPVAGNYAPPIRLAQLCAYPLLPSLVQVLLAYSDKFDLAEKEKPAQFEEASRYVLIPRAITSWLDLQATNPESVTPVDFAKVLSQSLLADICLMTKWDGESETVKIPGGYNLIDEFAIDSFDLPAGLLPDFSQAIHSGNMLQREPVKQEDSDLNALKEALSLDHTGSVFFFPLNIEKIPFDGFLLLSPFTDREWDRQDAIFIAGMTGVLKRFFSAESVEGTEDEAGTALVDDISGQSSAESLEKELEEPLEETADIEQIPPSINQEQVSESDDINPPVMESLDVETIEESIEIDQGEATESTVEPEIIETGTVDNYPNQRVLQIEAELEQALKDLALERNQTFEANSRILELEKKNSHLQQDNEIGLNAVTSLAQELNQPLASIIGYSDVLLSESSGILGAVQKEFLERVKSSADRIRSSLAQVVEKSGIVQPWQQPVELSTIIDHAIASDHELLKQKKISLQIQIPDGIPPIYTDEEALEQIVAHLVHNATLATPPEESVTVGVQVEDSLPDPHLLIKITDQGGGIGSEDFGRIFSRRYREDHPQIPGLGDTGVGLTVVKTLTEAHGGRIWVDSQANKSSTFSVLFPVHITAAKSART
jgi:signal transduction histidine kinase